MSIVTSLFIVVFGAATAAATPPTNAATAANQFAVDLYKECVSTQSPTASRNTFMSPISVLTAFVMLYNGARGNTKRQMTETLHLDQFSTSTNQDLNLAFSQLMRIFYQPTDSNFTLRAANRIYGRRSASLQNTCFAYLARFYAAGFETLDFTRDPSGSRQRINSWVEATMRRKIRNLIPEGVITGETVMVLVYLKASWLHAFDKSQTRPDDFHVSATNTIRVNMMKVVTVTRNTVLSSLTATFVSNKSVF
jgi:serpin B